MKKFILVMVALISIQFSTTSFAVSSEAAISFAPLDTGFRIVLHNIDISQISDCYWDGISICAVLVQEVNNGNIKISHEGTTFNIDIPLTESTSGIFNNSPIFSIVLSSGKELSAVAKYSFERDISYTGKDSVMESYLGNVITNLKNYKDSNPNLTDEQINRYAQQLIDDASHHARRSRRAITDMDGYISGKLNSKEYALYQANKYKGLLCMGNGKLALSYAASNYQNNVLHNGNGDAFRHALWNYGMVIDVGYSFAKTWSDAHEDGTNNPPLEKKMDLYNNAVGLRLGLDNPWTFFHSTFISNTKSKVRTGKMLVISNGKLVPSNSFGEK